MYNMTTKTALIKALAQSRGADDPCEGCFLTASGLIVGTIMNGNPTDAIAQEMLERVNVSVESDPVIDAKTYIILSDATIYLNSGAEKFVPAMVLFIDQVIGATLQNIPSVG